MLQRLDLSVGDEESKYPDEMSLREAGLQQKIDALLLALVSLSHLQELNMFPARDEGEAYDPLSLEASTMQLLLEIGKTGRIDVKVTRTTKLNDDDVQILIEAISAGASEVYIRWDFPAGAF